MTPTPLSPDELARRCDPSSLGFETTEELEEIAEVLGQARAVEAIRFGMGIRHDGYNLFALGPPGIGKHSVVQDFVRDAARTLPRAPAWCYVNDFEQSHRPRRLELPSGRAVQLRQDLDRLVEDLASSIPAAFESDEFRARRQEVEEEFRELQEQTLGALQQKAEERGIALIRTPAGLAFAPLREGEVLAPDEFHKLPKEEQAKVGEEVEALQEELRKTMDLVPQWKRAARERMKELTRSVTEAAVRHLIEELLGAWSDLPAVVAHLEAVRKDVVENADQFLTGEEGKAEKSPMGPLFGGDPRARRYQANVLVDHDDAEGAPVVYEDHPTYANLVGRVEHRAQFGALITDFLLIKPGALHRANGGYLILDARRLLQNPYAWEGLKRALRSREVRIESLEQALSLASTVSLEPEPVPLDVKVVLIGDRMLYYLLSELDPDFDDLFKVIVDFEEDMDRTGEGVGSYARLVATMARKMALRPLHATAVARVVDRGARVAGDAGRLSTLVRGLGDLLREADYMAGQAGAERVEGEHVMAALGAQERRAGRVRDRMRQTVEDGVFLIDTAGERVGQINGLSVIQIGGVAFGRPSRITARVRLGSGEVVDIERKVELGGPLHSKGVLILGGYLAGAYLTDRPLSLWASLVFEQSYGGVDGDSASSAELYALLSALAEAPIRQSLAVTGSVNQHGEIQAIGGANEKIEGFFDLCASRGLTGDQGVLIPASNVRHLMLRDDVVEAVGAGRFHVWPVSTIAEGVELLTGVPAGARGEDGAFPQETINGRVEARLRVFAEARRKAGGNDSPKGPGGAGDGRTEGKEGGNEPRR